MQLDFLFHNCRAKGFLGRDLFNFRSLSTIYICTILNLEWTLHLCRGVCHGLLADPVASGVENLHAKDVSTAGRFTRSKIYMFDQGMNMRKCMITYRGRMTNAYTFWPFGPV